MTDLKTLHDKLIRAAEAIAELYTDPILATMTAAPKTRKAQPIKRRAKNKGQKYAPGTHWTQRPGGKERLSAAIRRGQAKKRRTQVAPMDTMTPAATDPVDAATQASA